MIPPFRRRTRDLCTGLALGLTVCVASRVAAAAAAPANTIRLNFVTKDGLAPTHVCVVTEGVDNRLVPAQTQQLRALERLLCRRGESCDEDLKWDDTDSLYFSIKRASEGQTALAASKGEPLRADSELLRGLRGISRQQNEHECVYSRSTGCLPTFSLRGIDPAKDAYITCAENQAKTTGRRPDGSKGGSRGLVLGLSANIGAPLDHVQIHEMRLNGSHLLISTSHNVDKVDLVARSLGGFYTPEPEALFAQGHVEATMALDPRCQWTRVGIPPITSSVRSPDPRTGAGEFKYELQLELGAERTERMRREDEARVRAVHEGKHPEIRWSPRSPSPSEDRSQPDKCLSGSLQGSELQLLIPYEPNDTKILSLHSGERDPKTDEPLWEIEARWLGARPVPSDKDGAAPQRLDMSVRSLSFSWRADDCLYPQGECPEAMISTSGLPCRHMNTTLEAGLCRYRCVKGDDAYVDFPTQISFSRGTGAANRATEPAAPGMPYLKWSVAIDTIDEQLDGYVEPAERAFTVDTTDWRSPYRGRKRFPCDLYISRLHRRRCEQEKTEFEARRSKTRTDAQDASPAQRAQVERDLHHSEFAELREAICPGRPRHDDVFAIEFSTGSRERHLIEIDRMLRCDASDEELHKEQDGAPLAVVVKLPRVSCRDPITYRYIGARKYHEVTGEVKSGAIKLSHPMSNARYVYFSIALLPVAFQWVLNPVELQRKHSGLLYAPAIEGSVVFRPGRPATRGWRFNMDVTFMGAQRPYRAIGEKANSPDPEPQRSLYARWYMGFSFLSPWLGHRQRPHFLGPAVALGAGVQVGLGYPFLNEDLRRFGGVDAGLVALRGELRLRIWRFIEASFSPRLLLADEAIAYKTDFHGQPDVSRTRKMTSLLLPLGLAFVW